jgi:hypothetical protein
VYGIDPVDYCRKIAKELKKIEPQIKNVLRDLHHFGPREHKVIREQIGPQRDLYKALLERERATRPETVRDITPAQKQLTNEEYARLLRLKTRKLTDEEKAAIKAHPLSRSSLKELPEN